MPRLVFKRFPLCEFSLFDTPQGQFSGILGSWSQCFHSKGSGLDLEFCMGLYILFSAGQVLLSALSWCSACTSVSDGVFLMYRGQRCTPRPPTPPPSCSLTSPKDANYISKTYSQEIFFAMSLLTNNSQQTPDCCLLDMLYRPFLAHSCIWSLREGYLCRRRFSDL